MRVQLYEITVPKAKFFVPRLEPAYVLPIMVDAWKDHTPEGEDGVIATPIPFCRDASPADEWARLCADYGDHARNVHVSEHHLRLSMEAEAEKFARLNLIPINPEQTSGNIAVTIRPNVALVPPPAVIGPKARAKAAAAAAEAARIAAEEAAAAAEKAAEEAEGSDDDEDDEDDGTDGADASDGQPTTERKKPGRKPGRKPKN